MVFLSGTFPFCKKNYGCNIFFITKKKKGHQVHKAKRCPRLTLCPYCPLFSLCANFFKFKIRDDSCLQLHRHFHQ